VIAKQVAIVIEDYITSDLHQTFTLKDLAAGEKLSDLQANANPADYQAIHFDPVTIISPLLEKNKQDAVLANALGDYYYEAQTLFGDSWIMPADEAVKKAFDAYALAIIAGTDYYLAYANSAHYLLVTNEYATAIEYLDKAIALNPESPTTFVSVYLNKAHELSPESNDPLNYLTILYLTIGDKEQAAQTARAMFDANPLDPNVSQMIIQDYFDVNMLDEYTEMEARGNILFYRGYAYFIAEQKPAAVTDWENAKLAFSTVFPEDHQVFTKLDELLDDSE